MNPPGPSSRVEPPRQPTLYMIGVDLPSHLMQIIHVIQRVQKVAQAGEIL
jgi:hypothetical protein